MTTTQQSSGLEMAKSIEDLVTAQAAESEALRTLPITFSDNWNAIGLKGTGLIEDAPGYSAARATRRIKIR